MPDPDLPKHKEKTDIYYNNCIPVKEQVQVHILRTENIIKEYSFVHAEIETQSELICSS